VILDTLSNLGPVKDECNNSEVADYMAPLRAISEAGCSVLVIHHHGWGAHRSRGASALISIVDVVIDLCRVDDLDDQNRQRKLKVTGRPTDLVGPLTIELAEDNSGYTLVSGGQGADGVTFAQDTLAIMKLIAPDDDLGWTVAQYLEHWPAEPKPAEKTLTNVASTAAQSGGLRLVVKGKPGQPARYGKAKSPPPPAPGT
jgi:hypothetical protein